MQFSRLSPTLLCALISTPFVDNVIQVSNKLKQLSTEDMQFPYWQVFIIMSALPFLLPQCQSLNMKSDPPSMPSTF